MDAIRMLLSRCAAFFKSQGLDKDLDDELRSHIEMATEDNQARGMDREAARTAALREFGGATQTKEAYRTQRALPFLETLAQDIRFAWRQLRRSPGFTVTAVLTLALGIGGNTAVFSIVNGVLLNPLPFTHPEQLVGLHESKPNFENGSISYPNFLDWRKNNHSFSWMAVARGYSFTVTGRGDAEQVNADFISSGYFSLLGVRPILGREFMQTEDQPGAPPVAMISEGLWRRKFSASRSILGQNITLNGKNFSIVGVVPASLEVRTQGFRNQDVYVPVPQWSNSILMNRGAGLGFHGIGRLNPGVSVEQARADMERVTRNLAEAYPDTDRGIAASIIPLKEQLVGSTRQFLLVLLAGVGFVLLISCVNVASLLLARSAGRSREFAVRTALGAGRSRVIRQLLTESLFLGVAAGILGTIPAMVGMHAALKVLPSALPRSGEIGVDFRVLAFTAVISLLTGTLFGLAPALKLSKGATQTALKDGDRGTSGTRGRALSTFVVAEIAVALVLLTGAGLMIRSMVRLWNVDPRFNAKNVLTLGLSLPPTTVSASPDAVRATMRELNTRFQAASGVTAVSQTWGAVPMNDEDDQLFWIDGQPKPKNNNDMNWVIDFIVDPDYMKVMQLRLMRGRFLTAEDDERAPLVVVVDQVFAEKYFPGQDAIGKRIHLVNNGGRGAQIVGIVGHVKQWGLDADDTQALRAEYYLPCMQMPDDFLAGMQSGTGMALRYDGNLAAVLDSIRRVNGQMSNEQVIAGTQTMEDIISASMASRRFAMILLGAFAAIAMTLACVGIFGVMAYLVSQRTQEVGIRMALGAQRKDILGMVFGKGTRLTVMGICAGIVASLALTRLMGKLLFEVSPTDPVTLIAVALLLALMALIACYVPAVRAMRIDPMRALRTE